MPKAAWMGWLGLGLLLLEPPALGEAQQKIRAPLRPWVESGAPRGSWAEHTVPGTGERVRVYTPAGGASQRAGGDAQRAGGDTQRAGGASKRASGDAQRGSGYAIMLGFGVQDFGAALPTSEIVDVLVADERIAVPLIVLTDGAPEHKRIEEILRWARAVLHADTAAARVVVAGVGESGVLATKVALEHPGLIGNVLLLSDAGSAGVYDALVEATAVRPTTGVRIALGVDDGGPDLQRLRAALKANGYMHSIAGRRGLQDALASGIAFLLNPRFERLREPLLK